MPQWSPLFWELGEHDADDLLASGDAWQQMLAVLRAEAAEPAAFERVYVEAMRRLEPLATENHVRWYDLMRSILSWALWRRPRPERAALLTAAEAVQADVNRQKEVAFMGQTIAESIYQEGQAYGRTEGRAEGRAEGRTEGELFAARRLLRKLLTDRFGAVPESVVQRVENANDIDRLEAAALQVRHIATPDELQL